MYQAEGRKRGKESVPSSSSFFFSKDVTCKLQISSLQLTWVWRRSNSWLRQSLVTTPDAKFSSQTLFPFQTKLSRSKVVVFSGDRNVTFLSALWILIKKTKWHVHEYYKKTCTKHAHASFWYVHANDLCQIFSCCSLQSTIYFIYSVKAWDALHFASKNNSTLAGDIWYWWKLRGER